MAQGSTGFSKEEVLELVKALKPPGYMNHLDEVQMQAYARAYDKITRVHWRLS